MLTKYQRSFGEAVNIVREVHDDGKALIVDIKEMHERSKNLVENAEKFNKMAEDTVEIFEKSSKSSTKELSDFRQSLNALGSRWGTLAEGAFREGITGILGDSGYEVIRYDVEDKDGIVFGRPSNVEIDVVAKNTEIHLIEIKSSLDKYDVLIFDKKVSFYIDKEKPAADKEINKIAISPYVQDGTYEVASDIGVTVYTSASDVSI